MFLDIFALSATATPSRCSVRRSHRRGYIFRYICRLCCRSCTLLLINLIDKERLHSEGLYGDEPRIIWRAHLFLLTGATLRAGGLERSVIRPVVLFTLCFGDGELLPVLQLCKRNSGGDTRTTHSHSLVSQRVSCKHTYNLQISLIRGYQFEYTYASATNLQTYL